MLHYRTEHSEGGELEAWEPFDELDYAAVIAGDPRQSGRLDVGTAESPTQVGIWECTPGTMSWTGQGDETYIVLAGRARITDPAGRRYEVGPGDTVFTPKGDTEIWEVTETFRKIFCLHNVEPSRAAA